MIVLREHRVLQNDPVPEDADTEEEKMHKDPEFWALVIPGLLAIPFGMAIIYKNEGKIVRITGVLRHGKKQMKSNQDYLSASSSNEKELVHMKGFT